MFALPFIERRGSADETDVALSWVYASDAGVDIIMDGVPVFFFFFF